MATNEDRENERIRQFLDEELSDNDDLQNNDTLFAESDDSEEDCVEEDYVEDTDDTDADPDYEEEHDQSYDEDCDDYSSKSRKRKRRNNLKDLPPADDRPPADDLPPGDDLPTADDVAPADDLPPADDLLPADDLPPPDDLPPADDLLPADELPPPDDLPPPDEPHVADPHIIFLQERVVRAKNNHVWSTRPNPQNVRTPARNIVVQRRQVLGQARSAITARECFTELIDEHMLNLIIRHTNEQMDRARPKYANQTNTTSPINSEEMWAFLGLLVNTAFSKDNHLASRELFDQQWTGTRYKSVMSSSRFDFILSCLRFDERATREERKKNDPFAPIRELWNKFTSNCWSKYSPGSYVTVDEQLLGFRGKCAFRMYIPNKPSKYGLKIVMSCDTTTNYMINGIPYVGKKTPTGGLPISEFFVKEATTSIHGTNRNVTTDNWFTSVKLAEDLLKPPYKLTLVGTIRLNRKGVPGKVLSNKKTRPVDSSVFLFDKNKTLVSYKPKKNKTVTLLSSMHNSPTVNQTSKKPEIIHCYNQTKGAVDTMDQMCSNMSCSRKTRRWPLCVFFGLMNISFVNAYVIYCLNSFRNNITPKKRKTFMKELCVELTDPYMRTRLQTVSLRRNLRAMIAENLGVPVNPNNPNIPGVRKICHFCPSSKRRMTTNYCGHCHSAICGEHRAMCCVSCDDN